MHIYGQKRVLLSLELVGTAAPVLVDTVTSIKPVWLIVFAVPEGPVSPASAALFVSTAFAAVLLFLRGGIALRPKAVCVVILASTLAKAEMVVCAVSAI